MPKLSKSTKSAKSVRVGIPGVVKSDVMSLSGIDSPSILDPHLAKLLLLSQGLFGKERRRVLGVWLHDIEYHDPSHYFDEEDSERKEHDISGRARPRASDQARLAKMIDRSLSKVLGTGTYGVVGRVCRDSETCLALKISEDPHEARALQILGAMEKSPVPRFWGWTVVAHPDVPKKRLSVLAMEYITPWESFADMWDFLHHAPEDLVAKHLPGILRQVRDSLRALRAEFPGVRHNDLSPSNVMLTTGSATREHPDPRVVLVDWGMGDIPGRERLPGVETFRDYRGKAERVYQFYDARSNRMYYSEVRPTQYELAYVLPYRCDHYDWFYFLYRVRKIIGDRALHTPIPELSHMMAPYSVPEVLLNPNLVFGEGRLDGTLQLWTQANLPAP